ncbi:MAG TPA: ribose 1,5-bisphosphate isomerase, partial [Euryarchaeota archaeon]|nr:ribose 1,5-bisphosphate isomerase [Euryarchaeota archaeon]
MKNRTLQVVREGAEDIRTMRVRGATRLALHAARVLCRAAELEGREAEEKDIQDAAVILLNSRPTAISLSNALRYMLESSSG